MALQALQKQSDKNMYTNNPKWSHEEM